MSEQEAGPVMEIACRPPWLIVHFQQPQDMVSWAVAGGGRRRSRSVAWYQVRDHELPPEVVPLEYLRVRLNAEGLQDAVGLLTSHTVDQFSDVEKSREETMARCITTVGLTNALRAGDPAHETEPAGTINLLCWLSVPLTERAMLEALSLAAEARTAAMLDGGIPSFLSGHPATGTGTDCIVIAAPSSDAARTATRQQPLEYTGKHTLAGSLIGAVVYEAIVAGVECWKRNHGEFAATRES